MLSYNELLEQVKMGTLEGVDPANINGSSIDIRLGPKILIEKARAGHVIDLTQKESPLLEEYTMDDKGFVLNPGTAILAESMETFNLPSYITADLRLKSSVGRCFLEHLHSAHCDPCWHGSKLTMQLVNLCKYQRIKIAPGLKIGQIILHQHAPVPEDKSYARRGQYNNTDTVTASKGIK